MKAIGIFMRTVLILAVIAIGAAIAYAYSGHYDVSVGSGHMPWTNWYLETLRNRSIASRAAEIEVPDLTGSGMFDAGAVAYDEACAGCHGRPGRAPSDGFEPRPPALTRGQPDPAALFWVVRNGIKMSAMPRIGESRVPDQQVWQIAAFLQGASRLTEGEYRELVEPPETKPEATSEAEVDPEASGEGGRDGETAPEHEQAGKTAERDENASEDDEPDNDPSEGN